MYKRQVLTDEEVKNKYASRYPYGEWLDQNVVELSALKVPNHKVEIHPQKLRDKLYKAFGYTYEDLKTDVYKRQNPGYQGYIVGLNYFDLLVLSLLLNWQAVFREYL